MLQLAELLHKFLWEIEEMPATEYSLWLAYFRRKHREQELEKARQKVKGSSGGKPQTF